MSIEFRLKIFREFKNWQFEDVAERLNLSIKDYKDLEVGKVTITAFIAEQLSQCYNAPAELFLINNFSYYLQAEVLYNNCNITSGDGGGSGYINHQNNDRGINEILFSQKEELKRLEEQIQYLRIQNEKLIGMLSVQLDAKQENKLA